jgi:AraC-like DNA-binding protein
MNNHFSLISEAAAGSGVASNERNITGTGNNMAPFSILPFSNTKQIQRLSTQYELFLFTQGTGTSESGYTRNQVERGCVLCITPGCSFSITAHELQGYHISFSAGFLTATDVVAIPLLFKLLYHNSNGPFMHIIADDALETLVAVATGMQKECAKSGENSKDILQGLFFVFMTYLPYASNPVKQSDLSDRLFEYASHFITLVRTHYHTYKQVADYARMMCVTPGFLNNVIKKKTGQTASRHIYDIIVLEAKKKATLTTASMKEIAYDLGFADIYHFSKFFKKNSGLNFSRFRKEQTGMLSPAME